MERNGPGRFLEPGYEPSGTVTTTSTALQLVREAGLQVPDTGSPYVNPSTWRRVIDMLSAETITGVASELSTYELKNAFATLSMKVDSDSPFEVEDVVQITAGPVLHEEQDAEEAIEHIRDGMTYALQVLPPVTASLVGGYLNTVEVYEKDYYMDNVLPDGSRWGGMHRPFRHRIEVTGGCLVDVDDPFTAEPVGGSYSCTFLHELGHTVHTVYGCYRPRDYGYEYPSERESIESTGFLTPYSISGPQSTFFVELLKAYSLHHRDAFDAIRYDDYDLTHPAEAFACAFESLLREGEAEITENHWQFTNIFDCLY